MANTGIECFFKNWIWKKDWRSMGTPQRVAGDHIPCKVIGGSMWFPWFTLPLQGTDSVYFYPFLTASDTIAWSLWFALHATAQSFDADSIWQVQICATGVCEQTWPELIEGQRCRITSSTYNSKVNTIVFGLAPAWRRSLNTQGNEDGRWWLVKSIHVISC